MIRMLENPLEYPKTCRYEQFIALDDEKSPANGFSEKKKNYSECSMQVEIFTSSSSHMHDKGSNKAYFTEDVSTLGFNNCLAEAWGTTLSGNVLIPLEEVPFHSNGLGVQTLYEKDAGSASDLLLTIYNYFVLPSLSYLLEEGCTNQLTGDSSQSTMLQPCKSIISPAKEFEAKLARDICDAKMDARYDVSSFTSSSPLNVPAVQLCAIMFGILLSLKYQIGYLSKCSDQSYEGFERYANNEWKWQQLNSLPPRPPECQARPTR